MVTAIGVDTRFGEQWLARVPAQFTVCPGVSKDTGEPLPPIVYRPMLVCPPGKLTIPALSSAPMPAPLALPSSMPRTTAAPLPLVAAAAAAPPPLVAAAAPLITVPAVTAPPPPVAAAAAAPLATAPAVAAPASPLARRLKRKATAEAEDMLEPAKADAALAAFDAKIHAELTRIADADLCEADQMHEQATLWNRIVNFKQDDFLRCVSTELLRKLPTYRRRHRAHYPVLKPSLVGVLDEFGFLDFEVIRHRVIARACKDSQRLRYKMRDESLFAPQPPD